MIYTLLWNDITWTLLPTIGKSGYSLNGLRYSKKEFFLRCKLDGTYDVPQLTCQPINCTLDDAPTANMIEFSGGSLSSSSPVVLGPNEWLKYQCGDDHTLSGIPDSSDLFAMTCFDVDHTMTHCKPVQCGNPHMIAQATPLGWLFCCHHLRKAGRVPVRSWLSRGFGVQVWVETRRLPREGAR